MTWNDLIGRKIELYTDHAEAVKELEAVIETMRKTHKQPSLKRIETAFNKASKRFICGGYHEGGFYKLTLRPMDSVVFRERWNTEQLRMSVFEGFGETGGFTWEKLAEELKRENTIDYAENLEYEMGYYGRLKAIDTQIKCLREQAEALKPKGYSPFTSAQTARHETIHWESFSYDSRELFENIWPKRR